MSATAVASSKILSSDIVKVIEEHRRLIELGRLGLVSTFEMAISKVQCDTVTRIGDNRRLVLVEKDFTKKKND